MLDCCSKQVLFGVNKQGDTQVSALRDVHPSVPTKSPRPFLSGAISYCSRLAV